MTNLNLEVKKRFNLYNKVDRNIALSIVAQYVESLELQTLNRRQRVLKLSIELKRLQKEADAFTKKDYLLFANNHNSLYNVFFSHYLFYQCDEEPQLMDGLVLYEKLKCIAHLLKKEKKQSPPFNTVAFYEGGDNVFFYELDQRPWGTSQKDYYKMKTSCIQKKGECVNLEFESIRKRFVETVEGNPLYMDEVRSRIQLLNEVFEKHKQLTASQLQCHLSKLTGLLPGLLPEDMEEFQRQFNKFEPEKSFCHALSPQLIQLAHEQIGRSNISPAPICYLSLIKFKKWLTQVLKGEIGLNDPPDIHDKLLVEKCHEKSIFLSKELICCFGMQNPYGKSTNEQYKSILLGKLRKCRLELKEFKYPEYYHFYLHRENTQNLFIDQCWLDIYTQDHHCEMGQAIVLHEMIRFYMDKLSRLDQSLVNPAQNIKQMKKNFKVILSIMVPSPGIIERLWRAFNKFSHALSSQKPHYFIVEDLLEIFDEMFREAIRDLIDLLETQPKVVIETYAKKMILELEQQRLIKPKFGQGMGKYIDDLTRFSRMTLECSPDSQSSPLENNESPFNALQSQVIKFESDLQIKKIKTKKIKILSFYYKEIKDDKLALVLKALVILGALSKDLTVPQFRAIHNGGNVICPLEWLGTMGDLATFIKESKRINGKGFTTCKQPWKITAKCYVQKGGIPFVPQNLRLAKPTMLEGKFKEAAGKYK